MPEYSTSIPTGTTLWKMWKRDENCLRLGFDPSLVVGQYIPHRDPKTVGIRWHEVKLLEGPKPRRYEIPDWHNMQRYCREHAAR